MNMNESRPPIAIMRETRLAKRAEDLMRKGLRPESQEYMQQMHAISRDVDDEIEKEAYQHALGSLKSIGIDGITDMSSEAEYMQAFPNERYMTASDELKTFADLQVDQFMKGMKPITYAEWKDNQKPAKEHIRDTFIAGALTGVEGLAGMFASSSALFWSAYGPNGMAYKDGSWTEEQANARYLMSELVGGAAKKATREFFTETLVPKFMEKDVKEYVEQIAGTPDQPMIEREKYGDPAILGSHGLGAMIGQEAQNVGSAVASMPLSVPSMLAPNAATRAVATAPFALLGYGDAQIARWDMYKEQVAMAREMGVVPPPLPSFGEMETLGLLGGAVEWGGEFAGDQMQVGLFKSVGGKKVNGKWRFGNSYMGSMMRSLTDGMKAGRGITGATKRAGIAIGGAGLTEGVLEEGLIPNIGIQLQDAASNHLFTPEDSYWNIDRPFFDLSEEGKFGFLHEDVWTDTKIGTYAGVLQGGAYMGFQKAKDIRQNIAVTQELKKGGTAFVTEALVEDQAATAEQRAMSEQVAVSGKEQGGKSRSLGPEGKWRRGAATTRGSVMAMRHIDEMASDDGRREIMLIDPSERDLTITPEVKEQMVALGIGTKPIGTVEGRLVYAPLGAGQKVLARINRGEVGTLVGNPMLNEGNVIAGMVVYTNAAGQVVETMPFSDRAQFEQNSDALAEAAARRGLKMQVVDSTSASSYAQIEDQVRRQLDIDAEATGRPKIEQRPVPKRDTKRAMETLRFDIRNEARGSKNGKDGRRADPNAPFTSSLLSEEEVGGAANKDVKVVVSLTRVSEDGMSAGERNIVRMTNGQAMIVEPKVVYEIRQKDGSVKRIEKDTLGEGMYMPQSSPDGIILLREGGQTFTRRNAMAIGTHEITHRTGLRTRAGAQHLAKLFQIDPTFAARGGVEYMRTILAARGSTALDGMSDAKVIAYYRGLSMAVKAVEGGTATPEQARTIREAGGAAQAKKDVQTFAAESVTTTANRAVGTLATLAAEHEWNSIHDEAQSHGWERFSRWMGSVLVRNGMAGPEAQQMAYEWGQRARGVREEELKIHQKFSEEVARKVEADLQESEKQRRARQMLQAMQQQTAAPAAAPAAPAAPPDGGTEAKASVRMPSGPMMPTVGGDGERETIASAAELLKAAEQAPPEQRQTLLSRAIDAVMLLSQTQAQIAPASNATRPSTKSYRTRNIPQDMRPQGPAAAAAPADQPFPPIDATEAEAVAVRQRNAQNAVRIIEGDPTEGPVAPNTVARIQRTRTLYQTPNEEIRMSVGGRYGRRDANQTLRDIRSRYMESRSIQPEQEIEDTYAPVDEEFAKRVADWFESTPVNYDDPEMLAAYEQFGKETLDQYRFIASQGIEMIPWAGEAQPYANSADMLDDLRENKRLFYYKTNNPQEALSFGSNPEAMAEAVRRNPLLKDSGIEVLDSDGNPYRQTYNDLFRAVHDIFGHGPEGFQFGARGEENAFRSHAVMFSPLARRAMATETRGQNSWVNFGPNRRNPDGSVWGQDDPRFEPWKENLNKGLGYADQKPILMPQELMALYSSDQPEGRASLRPIKRSEMTPEMATWSEGSKVVDENGDLIPVYHGTSKDKNFDKFKIGKRGAWFTTDPASASEYAMQNDSMDYKPDPTPSDPFAMRKTNTASRVVPAVLNLRNPAKFDRDVSEEDRSNMRTANNYALAQARVFDKLRRQGFDGVDMGNGVYVAFNPNQVKGYFNERPTSDPRIMRSLSQPSDELKKQEAKQRRIAAEEARKEKVLKEASLDKPAISISAEVTAQPFINPNIVIPSYASDSSFSMQNAYERINDRITDLLGKDSYRTAVNAVADAVTNGRVKAIGAPRKVLGVFGGRVEQSMRIGIPNASHEDHVAVSNILGSLLLQEAAITVGPATSSTPRAEQGHSVLLYANQKLSDADLRTLLAKADKPLNGASSIEGGLGVWAVYTPYAGNPITLQQFLANAKAFADAEGLVMKKAKVRSTYTNTGATDVLGRRRQNRKANGDTGSDRAGTQDGWGLWVDAAVPIVEALRDEGFDINIGGWIGVVAGPESADVEKRLLAALAERERQGRHGLSRNMIHRARVSGQGLIDGRAIPATVTPSNAEAAFKGVDALLARHPNALDSEENYERFLIDLFKSREIPPLPRALMEGLRNNAERMRKEMNLVADGGRLTNTMVDEAIHGLDMAQRLKAMYSAGKVQPTHTVALAMWGFLSRGVSPYIQEGLFLDIVNYKSPDGFDLAYFVDIAMRGEWTSAETYAEPFDITNMGPVEAGQPPASTTKIKKGSPILPDPSTDARWRGFIEQMFRDNKYEESVDPSDETSDVVERNASIGSSAKHNAMAFGESFLNGIGRVVTINGKKGSGLTHYHNALADQNTSGRTVRRVFASLGGGLGIDNKVVGFSCLVAGKTDVSVYDRVRVRDHYDRNGEYPNIYDGYSVGFEVFDGKTSLGKFVASSDMRNLSAGQQRAALVDPKKRAKEFADKINSSPDRPRTSDGKIVKVSIKPLQVGGIANLFNGARGIAVYEAAERAIDPNKVFADLIKKRPDMIPFANLGAEHWLNWVGASAQEASHKTLDGLIQMIGNGDQSIVGVFAKEGRYDTYSYGAEYGYTQEGNKPKAVYRYEIDGKTFQFDPPAYHRFISSLKDVKWDRIGGASPSGVPNRKFMVTKDSVTGQERTAPWRDDPMVGDVGRKKIAELAAKEGVRLSVRDQQDQIDVGMQNFVNAILDTASRNDIDLIFGKTEMARAFARDFIGAQSHDEAHQLYKQMVVGKWNKPTHPNYVKYFDRDNALNGIVPNDVWFHGTSKRWVEPDFDRKPEQFGLHIGNFDQASDFMMRALRKPYQPLENEPVMLPLYVTARNPLVIPDMGYWQSELVILGMEKMGILDRDQRLQMLADMYRDIDVPDAIRESAIQKVRNGSDAIIEALNSTDAKIRGRLTPYLLPSIQWMRSQLEKMGYDAIKYQNNTEGMLLSRFHAPSSAFADVDMHKQVHTDEQKESYRKWMDGMVSYDEWLEANPDASGVEREEASIAIRGDMSSLLIWNIGQTKSASASNVQYQRDKPDIRASIRVRPNPLAMSYPQVFLDQTDSRMSVRRGLYGQKDRFVTEFIDQYDVLRRYGQQAARNLGGNLPDIANPYQAARLLGARTGAMQLAAEREYADILRDMHEHNISIAEMDQFLVAQHALNGGNQYIADITRDPATGVSQVPDGGTGMMNADAQAIIQRANASGRYGDMNRIASDWREMLRAGLQLRLANGLITQETYDILTTRYTHYVPLRGLPHRPEDEVFEDLDMPNPFGRGISTASRGMPNRYGRESMARGVTSQVGFVHEDTLRRIERNTVGQRFLNLTLLVNDPNMAEVIIPNPQRFTVVNGRRRTVYDQSWADDNRNFGLFVNAPITIDGHDFEAGDLVVIRLNNPRLVEALNTPNLPLGLFSRAIAHVTNAWKFVTTGFGNPFFPIVNAAKDVQTAMGVNYAERGVRDTVQMLMRYPSAFVHVFREAWMNPNQKRDQRRVDRVSRYNRFINAGGDMVAWRGNDMDVKRADFDALMQRVARRDPADRSLARTLFGWYTAYFAAAETAVRLAQFEQRLATGSNLEQAALAARDITVDFGKGGRQKKTLNAWYAFINASIQGSTNIVRATARAATLAPSLVMLGLVNGLINRALGGEDEKKKQAYWDNIPQHEKASNMFFFDPSGSGKHIKLPLPYGFNVFYSAGVRMADAAFGRQTAGDAIGGMVTDALNSFNPMGGSGITSGMGSVVTALFPTMVRPLPELALNKNWMDRPIYPNNPFADASKPEAYEAFGGTPQPYLDLAESLNEMTGGDRYEKGAIDWSPNSMQYLVGYYGSGAARNLEKFVKMATNPDEVEPKDIPLMRSFFGDASQDTRATSEQYYAIANRVAPDMARAKVVRDPNTPQDVLDEIDIDKISRANLALGVDVAEAEKRLAKVRKALKNATPEQRKNLLEIRKRTMETVIRRSNELTEG